MGKIPEINSVNDCSTNYILAIHDTLNVLNGKWKTPIIAQLLFGKKRFTELEKTIPKINPRMLSKELKDLEANGIIKRTVYDTIPVTVEYELTKSGYAYRKVLDVMLEWGLQHRKNIIGKKK